MENLHHSVRKRIQIAMLLCLPSQTVTRNMNVKKEFLYVTKVARKMSLRISVGAINDKSQHPKHYLFFRRPK
jgi:hypothetical protein